MPDHFLFLLCSGRPNGNSEHLARLAAARLPADTTQTWLDLATHPLPPFEDRRHDGIGYAAPTGHERTLFDATLAATDIVLVAPLYWYSLPAPAKLYLDWWSAWLRATEVDFAATMAGRTLWAITAMSDEDPSIAEPLVGTLVRSADYMAMRYGGTLLGYGNRPGDVLADAAAVARAATFFAAR